MKISIPPFDLEADLTLMTSIDNGGDLEFLSLDPTTLDNEMTLDIHTEKAPPAKLAFTKSLQQYKYNTSLTTARRSTRLNGTTVTPELTTLDTLPRSVSKRRVGDEARSNSTDRSSRSPAKRQRSTSKYAAPAKYAHLPALTDILESDLICIFVGVNPGLATSRAGHAYAHPSNLFWKLLYSSGCTDRRCKPEEDVDLPRLYSMGNTNIVERPTKDQSELSKDEMVAGTPVLDTKFRNWKPEAVCVVGKGIWEAIWKYRYGKNITKAEFRYGWQDEKDNMGKGGVDELHDRGQLWTGARVFVACSTSGLSASLRPPEKEAIWKPFGEWVSKRRIERLQEIVAS